MTTTIKNHCQCKSTLNGEDDPCNQAITAEDLLCNHCRQGCNVIVKQVAPPEGVHREPLMHPDGTTWHMRILYSDIPLIKQELSYITHDKFED